MKRSFCLLFVILFSALLPFFSGCSEAPHIDGLHLAEVGPFSATLEWTTGEPSTFHIQYGEGTLFDREATEERAATEHRLTLTGLKPSTRYSCRIEPGGPTFPFRSAPGRDGAFDLVVLDSASPACGGNAPDIDVDPDLVVLAGDCAGPPANRPESILTIRIPSSGARELLFGRYRILASPDVETAEASRPDSEDAGLRRIVILPALPEKVPEGLGETVLLSAGGAWFGGRTTLWGEAETAWFEVDILEIARVRGAGEGRSREVIVEAPPETKKTCLYCDRLMESGRYEESVAWYRRFIVTNRDRHAVEDAAFSVARILDEKLFRYRDALKEYGRFLEVHPKSRKAALARYRLDYLLAHGDHGFQPLGLFERAKAGLVRSDPLPSAEKVEGALREFPDASVAEDALFWLGNLFETVDPERARSHYGTLMQRFPGGENAAMASIAMGDILYRAKSYRRAIEAYEKASETVPKKYRIAVSDKLRKSRRNIRREWARRIAWVILVGWLAASIALRARPARTDVRAALIVLAAYGLLGGLYFACTYETSRPLAPALSILAPAMCVVMLWSRALSRNLRRGAWIVVLHALSCSVAVLYLVMYGFHHVYVFGL